MYEDGGEASSSKTVLCDLGEYSFSGVHGGKGHNAVGQEGIGREKVEIVGVSSMLQELGDKG